MLRVSRLDGQRSEVELFSNLTISVDRGQWCWVRGGNGSGKSTFLKLLAGLLPLNKSANLVWKGQTVNRFEDSFLQDLLYIGHKPPLHPALTPLENLQWLSAIAATKQMRESSEERPFADPRAQLIWALSKMGIVKLDLPCEQLSFGQRQRVSLARLWLSMDKLWILDEPCTGLDKAGHVCLEECLTRHLTQGGIAVIASHIAFKTLTEPQQVIDLQNAA